MLKLNLGSGTSRYQDYLSVDYITEADLTHDLTQPLPYDDETVDKIYSSHVIEHFTRDEWEGVRQDWVRVLKPGGEIEIRCPDIVKLSKLLAAATIQEDFDLQLTRIYGQQGDEGQLHKNGFNRVKLIRDFQGLRCQELEPSTDYELHMRFVKPL